MNEIKKINCIVIDDEEAAINVLQHFISQIPYLNYINGYTAPLEGLQAIQEQEIDLAFIDIQMPEISGLDLIKNITGNCKVILTTAYSQYALEGYDLNVVDYLVKPISLNRFLKAVEKVKILFRETGIKNQTPPHHSPDSFILVKGDTKGKFIKINIGDIDYIEALKNYAAIICGNKKILTLIKIKDLEEKLPAHKFIRVHKSFIVSIVKITSIEGNIIRLKDHPNATILIGDTFKHSFLEKMRSGMIP